MSKAATIESHLKTGFFDVKDAATRGRKKKEPEGPASARNAGILICIAYYNRTDESKSRDFIFFAALQERK